MSHPVGCLVNCKKNGQYSNLKSYNFPVACYKVDKNRKYVATVEKMKQVSKQDAIII